MDNDKDLDKTKGTSNGIMNYLEHANSDRVKLAGLSDGAELPGRMSRPDEKELIQRVINYNMYRLTFGIPAFPFINDKVDCKDCENLNNIKESKNCACNAQKN
jgi:hypothetical protein